MKKYRQVLLVCLSFLAAWILMILPIPHDWQYVRPEWLTLVLIYWIFVHPQWVGIATAWCVGLVMDSLYGGILGQYALSLTMVAFFARFLRYRIRLIPVWQQALVIFALIGINESILFLVQWMIGHPPRTIYYWVPMITSMLLWPWIRRLMKFYEHKLFA